VIPSFERRFDGSGFTLSTLTLRGDCFLGLFGVLWKEAVVERLQIDKAGIVAGNSATGLGLLAVENWGRITDCRVVGEITGGSKDKKYAGILERNSGTIMNCEPIANAGPYTTIITDPEATRWFLKYEGIHFDDVWIPAEKDLEGLDDALMAFLDSDTPLPPNTWVDRQSIITDFRQYHREYAGYTKSGGKYIICLMHLYDDRDSA